MKVEQILSSGLILKQNIKDAIRFVMFDTGLPEWQYATDGGTAFIVSFHGKLYGLTCGHVFTTFKYQQLVITDQKFGKNIAGLKGFFSINSPEQEAIGTDILDVAIIEFTDDVDLNFFDNTAYILDEGTTVTSEFGDKIMVAGALKDLSMIDEEKIAPVYCDLSMIDEPDDIGDPTLRYAIGQFSPDIEFDSITGLSGSPVFNVSKNKLTGMVVRGNLRKDKYCQIRYVDIFDIMKVLQAISAGEKRTFYKKNVLKEVKS